MYQAHVSHTRDRPATGPFCRMVVACRRCDCSVYFSILYVMATCRHIIARACPKTNRRADGRSGRREYTMLKTWLMTFNRKAPMTNGRCGNYRTSRWRRGRVLLLLRMCIDTVVFVACHTLPAETRTRSTLVFIRVYDITIRRPRIKLQWILPRYREH